MRGRVPHRTSVYKADRAIEPLHTKAGRAPDAEQFHVTSQASIGGRLAVYEQIGDAMDAINLGGKAQP